MFSAIGLVVAGLMLGGCQNEAFRRFQNDFGNLFAGSHRGDAALAEGIRQYEEGKYPAAGESLNRALYEGLSSPDQVKAHKYLAFIECTSGRPFACRREFRRALGVDPNLELSAAEAGHPIWGPVFRAVKAGR